MRQEELPPIGDPALAGTVYDALDGIAVFARLSLPMSDSARCGTLRT